MPKIWTKEELEILSNTLDKENIVLEGRTKAAIHKKLISLGLVKKAREVRSYKKIFWNDKEINLLISSKDPKNVKIPGRSRDSIVRMASELNLFEKQKARRPWKKEDENIVINLAKEGKTPAQIFKMNVIPHSKTSIQKKMSFFGFSKKAPKVVRFSEVERKKLKKFLQDNWQGKTPRDIMDLWNNQSSQKISYKKIIYYLTALNIKIPHSEVIRINNLKKQEEKIKEKNANPVHLIDSIKKARMESMMSRLAKKRDFWTGMPLTESELLISENDQ